MGRKLDSRCFACGQEIWIYERKLNSSMALGLAVLAKAGDGWHHVNQLFRERFPTPVGVPGGDFPKLRFWGLIIGPEDSAPDENPSNGQYQITDLGMRFLHGETTEPRYIFVRLNARIGQSDERTTWREALGDKWTYAEQMQVTPAQLELL